MLKFIRTIYSFLAKLLNLENLSEADVSSSTASDFLLQDLFSADCFADVDYAEELRKYEEYKRCNNV